MIDRILIFLKSGLALVMILGPHPGLAEQPDVTVSWQTMGYVNDFGDPGHLLPVGGQIPEDSLHTTKQILYGRYGNPQKRKPARPSDLAQLERAKNLELLEIVRVDIPASGFLRLRELPHLKILTISDMTSSDENMKAISKLPHIKYLRLNDSDISNKSAEYFSQMKNLKFLDLTGTNVDSKFLAEFDLPEGLIHLRISSDKLGADFFKHSKLPRSLTHLYVSGRAWDESPIGDLSHLDHLKDLSTGEFGSQADKQRIREQLPHTRVGGKYLNDN